MTMQPEVSRQYAPRQFSLAGLMSFFLACGLYFGLVSVTAELMSARPGSNPALIGRAIGTVVISWGGLWALYRCWKLKAALVIHYTGPFACGMLGLAILPFSLIAHSVGESVLVFVLVFLYGPFISVLFGFPVVVLMLIYRVLRRD
jgi:hypothetical protein